MPCPTTCRQLVDLEVQRPRPIGDDVILVGALGHVDAVGALRKQVDRRRAEQRDVRRIDDALELGVAAPEEDARAPARCPSTRRSAALQTRELEEPEALRKREVLLQQPVALERPQVTGSSASLSAKPTGRIDAARAATRASAPHPCRRAPAPRVRAPQTQLVELGGHVVAAGQIEASGGRAPVCENFSARRRLQADAQAALDALRRPAAPSSGRSGA